MRDVTDGNTISILFRLWRAFLACWTEEQEMELGEQQDQNTYEGCKVGLGTRWAVLNVVLHILA